MWCHYTFTCKYIWPPVHKRKWNKCACTTLVHFNLKILECRGQKAIYLCLQSMYILACTSCDYAWARPWQGFQKLKSNTVVLLKGTGIARRRLTIGLNISSPLFKPVKQPQHLKATGICFRRENNAILGRSQAIGTSGYIFHGDVVFHRLHGWTMDTTLGTKSKFL